MLNTLINKNQTHTHSPILCKDLY